MYIMNDFIPMATSKQYFNTILSSYKQFGFDTDCLKKALVKTIVTDEFCDDELCTEFVNSYFHNDDMRHW